ncbi:MAG: hypothetical protein J7L77_07490 [Clostridiales bacterium]|nr:hypothetical protein [Clostridiales bacterium]
MSVGGSASISSSGIQFGGSVTYSSGAKASVICCCHDSHPANACNFSMEDPLCVQAITRSPIEDSNE